MTKYSKCSITKDLYNVTIIPFPNILSYYLSFPRSQSHGYTHTDIDSRFCYHPTSQISVRRTNFNMQTRLSKDIFHIYSFFCNLLHDVQILKYNAAASFFCRTTTNKLARCVSGLAASSAGRTYPCWLVSELVS